MEAVPVKKYFVSYGIHAKNPYGNWLISGIGNKIIEHTPIQSEEDIAAIQEKLKTDYEIECLAIDIEIEVGMRIISWQEIK